VPAVTQGVELGEGADLKKSGEAGRISREKSLVDRLFNIPMAAKA